MGGLLRATGHDHHHPPVHPRSNHPIPPHPASLRSQVHQWQVSVRALREVLGLSQGQRAHLGILGEIVGEIERARAAPSADAAGAAGAHPAAAAAAAAAATGSSAGTAAAAAEGATAAPRAAPLQPSGAEEAAADQEGADEAEPSTEGVEALAQALASVGSMGTGSSSSTGAPSNTQQQAPAAAAASWRNPEVLAAAEAHAKEALERAAGLLLKEVAGTGAGDSAFWELYARWVLVVGLKYGFQTRELCARWARSAVCRRRFEQRPLLGGAVWLSVWGQGGGSRGEALCGTPAAAMLVRRGWCSLSCWNIWLGQVHASAVLMDCDSRKANPCYERLPIWHRCCCRYYAAVGQAEAARECLLKRVRALAGRGWQQQEEGFKAFAHASLQLCRNYLQVRVVPSCSRSAVTRGLGI